ncbi:MAG: hypothetical protein ACRCZG_05710 [Culicoidibacterales bacterium]
MSVWDAEVFEIITIEFEVQNSMVITKDAFGNERTTTDVISVQLKPRSASKRYRDMIGLTEQVVLFDCRCVEPETLPDGIVAGTTGKLELNGLSGMATIEPIFFSSIKAVAEALGQRVFISWRAT